MAHFMLDRARDDPALLEAVLWDLPGAWLELSGLSIEESIPTPFRLSARADVVVWELSARAVERVRVLQALSGLFAELYEAPGRKWFTFAETVNAQRMEPVNPTWRIEREIAVSAMRDLVSRLDGLRQVPSPRVWHGYLMRARMRHASAVRPLPPQPSLTGRRVVPEVRQHRLNVVYSGFCVAEEHTLQYERLDGRLSDPIERTVVSAGDAAAVLPFDPVRGEVLLIEQFRVSMYARAAKGPVPVEIIAGRIDAGGSPEDTARREAHEEAGLELGRIVEAASYFPSPGVLSDRTTIFVAEADLAGAEGVFGLASEGEEIKAIAVPVETAIDAAFNGEIETGQALVAILWLSRNRAVLEDAWRESPGQVSA